MAIALSTPVTGGAQTGFTSPTYTVTPDVAPTISGKQWAVTALGGTQAGVRTHSPSDPFTLTWERPGTLRTLANLISGLTGLYGKVPMNVYTGVRVRKGVNIAANNVPRVMMIDMKVSIPAGADSYDSANVRAAVSAAVGSLNQLSPGLGDTVATGII
jgi:hypothetical protein